MNIFAVGIGSKINPKELKIIAMGQKEHLISVSGFNYLAHVLANVRDEACNHSVTKGI